MSELDMLTARPRFCPIVYPRLLLFQRPNKFTPLMSCSLLVVGWWLLVVVSYAGQGVLFLWSVLGTVLRGTHWQPIGTQPYCRQY